MKKIVIIFLMIIVSIQIASALPSNLTGYWKFNEGSGSSAADSSGLGNTLSAVGSPTFQLGKLGNATNITYTSGYNMWNGSTGNSNWTFGTGNFTVAYWFNVPTDGMMFVHNFPVGSWASTNGWAMYVLNTGQIRIAGNGANLFTTGVSGLNNASWHRVVMSREGTGSSLTRIYVDGINVGNFTFADNLNANNDLIVGRDGVGSDETTRHKGLIDDLRVYKGRAWTSEEVVYDYNTGNGRETDQFISTIINTPSGSTSTDTPVRFNITSYPYNLNLTNATITVWNSLGAVFNRTTRNVTGSLANYTIFDIYNFTAGDYRFGFNVCGANSTTTLCFSTSNRTLQWGSSVISNIYNSTTYETALESFFTNISVANGTVVSSARLIYAGTGYTGTVTSLGGSNYTLSRSIDIPTGVANNTWFWNITFSSGTVISLASNIQEVLPTNFTICSALPSGYPYLNLTFKDESNGTVLSGYLDSTSWTYYLGSGTKTKGLTYSSSTLTPSYAFCSSPTHLPINVNSTIQFSSTGYQQRRITLSDLYTNSTTNQILYLVSSSTGIYSSISVTNTIGNPIPGASVTLSRTLSGVSTIVEQGTTDSSGTITFWVDPNADYTVVTTASGYLSSTVTIRPTQTAYTVVLSQSGGNVSFQSDLEGIKYYFNPSTGLIQPNISTNFNVTITASKSNLVSCMFELVNQTGTISNTTSSCSGASGYLSITYTPRTNEKIYGLLYIDVGGGLFALDRDAYWIGYNKNISQTRTLKGIIGSLNDLNEFGEGVEQEFSRIVFFFMTLTIVLGIITFFSGYDFSNPGAAVWLLYGAILFFSISGWFNFEGLVKQSFIVTPGIQTILNQYIFLIIMTFIAFGRMFNTIRRQS